MINLSKNMECKSHSFLFVGECLRRSEYPNWVAGVWVGAQVDPLVVFVGVVSELGWG